MATDKLETAKQIYIEAKNFHRAILKVSPDSFRFATFNLYPKNCCEYISLLLAKYLIECKSYTDIKMLRGENKYKTRHVWLKINDIDVDITAHQFSSTNRTVIVEHLSEWHQRYKIFQVEQPNIDFEGLHDDSTEPLLNDYYLILQNLKI